ncbi:ribosomal RNA processing protein 36 homolog [Actinia tenebrosa]|uniref:rRNA biogenesis protein RRP36 n=1 Tax=Actinia tenebrosa TaxID=6105 RepID=A0A6P8IQQ8_ACTTE|nr:ribosomal RNA processing protein 36 homolog [Actinia tenebrosa]
MDRDGSSSSSEESDIEERAVKANEDDDKLSHLRTELSQIPFCELQDLRNKVGSKRYNEAIHGFVEDRKNTEKTSSKTKKKSKNNPLEISSKQKVSRIRQVVAVKKKVARDPRFDDLSGQLNEEMFSKAYGFVDEMKANEKKEIEKELMKTKNAERKETLKMLLKRMKQQEESKKKKKMKDEERRKRKKEEMELVKQGKKPFYLKKSERKKLELAEKYKKLKSSGKLEKYLSKRRKKTASKDRKHIPHRRQADS